MGFPWCTAQNFHIYNSIIIMSSNTTKSKGTTKTMAASAALNPIKQEDAAPPSEEHKNLGENVLAKVLIQEEIDTQKPSSIASLLAKRKAEQLIHEPAAPNTVSPPPPAKLSSLDALVRQLKDQTSADSVSFPSNSFITPNSSPQRFSQRTTAVQFNEWYVENGTAGEETTVCITIANVYALKDQLLGFQPLPGGDMIYWPSRMFYPNQVSNVMAASNVNTGYDFLKSNIGKPLIVFSRLSENTSQSLLNFDEVVLFLKEFIEGRVDEASTGNPKKTFHMTIQKNALSEAQLHALVAVSARIYNV
jgi:hypothetical protein